MLERFSYINYLGESILFGDNDIYVNANELYDFEWDIISKNDRISGFERRIHTKTIPVRIGALSEEDGIRKRNRLFEVPEKDIFVRKPGKLIVNGFYLLCYVTSSKKSYYSIDGKFLSCDITITTDNPFWIREVEPEYQTFEDDEFIINESAFDSNFCFEISGYIVNPEIVIDGHSYRVNRTISANEKLIIDSSQKKVYVINSDTSEVYNAFNARSRSSYIFQKIPAGRSVIEKPENCVITLYNERSEPKWISDDERQAFANWTYRLEEDCVIETTGVYPSNSGIYFYINEAGYLIQESEEGRTYGTENHGKLINGELVIYHD